MASNINWNLLGAVPQDMYRYTPTFDVNPDSLIKGMEQFGEVFDRWNRESAIDRQDPWKQYQTKKQALQAKIQEIASRLRSLQDELRQAKTIDPQYQADQAYALASNADPTVKMDGYPGAGQTARQNMFGYNPNIQVRF